MPMLPYTILGLVTDSLGNKIVSVEVSFTNTTKSSNPLVVATDSNGRYITDAGNFNTGYDSGDNVLYYVFNSFKDEKKESSFVISGDSRTLDIQTEIIKTLPADYTGRTEKVSLVNSSGKPYQPENPLPVSSSEIDFLNNPSKSFEVTNSDGQPESETITIRGINYKKTFTYTTIGGTRVQTGISSWVKQ